MTLAAGMMTHMAPVCRAYPAQVAGTTGLGVCTTPKKHITMFASLRHGWVQVQRGNRRYKNSEDAETALSQLVQAGQGEFVVEPPSSKGGPPKRVFRLLPITSSTKLLESAEIRGLGDVDGVEEVA